MQFRQAEALLIPAYGRLWNRFVQIPPEAKSRSEGRSAANHKAIQNIANENGISSIED